MESPNSPSSPDMSHKRAGRPQSPPSDAMFSSMAEDKEKVTYVRFLVSNTAAGCIIGKGGSTITEFQTQSGARIQLSRNHEFFPGTSDRIIMISGALDEIVKATELITEKLFAEADDSGDGLLQKRDNSDAENRTKLRLIVPNGCCGGIIGKGGTTIKSFIEDSQAGIKISPQDNMYSGVNDRIVTLTGSPKEQLRALCLILSKLSEDAHYSQSVNIPYPYAGFHGAPVSYVMPPVPYNAINYGQNGAGGKFPNPKGNSRPRSGTQEGHGHSVTIGVADEHIGAVVGRGGRNIMEITQASGARIKISDRGDFMTGTTDRKVTITGSQEAIRAAEDMIMQRISLSAET